MDQWGDMVDPYDFAGQGKYVVVHIAAIWNPPCNDLASAIASGNPNAGWGRTPKIVHDENIYLVNHFG